MELAKLGYIPEDLKYNAEKEEEILKKAGCRDLINLMRCRNCLRCHQENGKNICSDTNKETNLDATCSIWTENLAKEKELKEIFDGIKDVLASYLDMKDEYYDLVSLWILGTWFHKSFATYPYLFINAMKGSGKTRLLKLIKELSCEGDMLASLSDAVLFRTTGTLCIDEFENVGSKDKASLRELLNTAYKEGGKVKRAKKKHTQEGDEQIIEEFDTYRPIAIANIWGMDEVLGDRCISIVLEKSDSSNVTRKVENFSKDPKILKVKEKFSLIKSSVVKCSVVTEKNIYTEWNEFIDNNYINIHNTYIHTNNIYISNIPTPNYTKIQFFTKIYETGINGRNLELSMALLMLGYELGILDRILRIMNNIVDEKKDNDNFEGRDVQLFDLISKKRKEEWYKVKLLEQEFKQTILYDPNEEKWLNAHWMGRALKRLNLISNKRRTGEGIEVCLDIEKAKSKMTIFKKDIKEVKQTLFSTESLKESSHDS